MKVPTTIATLLVGIVLTLLSLWYGQNNGLLPAVASVEASKIDQLFNAMMAISTGLFIIVQGALLYSVFAFRQRQGDETDAEPIEGNVPLEILWTAIPAAIVMWLAIYSLDVYSTVNSGGFVGSNHMAHAHTNDAAIAAELGDSMGAMPVSEDDDALHVQVNGMQYAWIFTYPETGVVSGELHLPRDRVVKLDIDATDVLHAFWVPEFRLKQDAVPGQQTHLSFTPSREGEYPVICAELCGAYHGAMRTRAIVHTPEDFQTWEESQRIAQAQGSAAIATRPTSLQDARLIAASHQHHLPRHLAMAPHHPGMEAPPIGPGV